MPLGRSALACYNNAVTEIQSHHDAAVWGAYPNYDDVARFEYGRRLWKLPEMRVRLLAHWLDERHPHRERFIEQRAVIENLLDSTKPVHELDSELRRHGTSLRCFARKIPPVFGSFFSC
jgi:hypothetical protein